MVPLHTHPAGMRINVVNNHPAKQVREQERVYVGMSVCVQCVRVNVHALS